MYSQYKMAK